MLISLDYDKTYTLDTKLWDAFIKDAKSRGHEVIMVTLRWPHETLEYQPDCEVEYACRMAKRDHMSKKGRHVDIWIDDMPYFIDHNAMVV